MKGWSLWGSVADIKGTFWFFIGAAIAFLPLTSFVGVQFPNRIQDVWMVFLSVVLEAIPFLLLGAIISAAVQNFSWVYSLLDRFPRRLRYGLPLASLMGVLLPVCECGNVPIARSLVARGLSPVYATVFLFASPILNPAVFLSTFIAFRGDWTFIIGRFVFGFLVTMLLGVYVWWQEKNGRVLWQSELIHAQQHHIHHAQCSHQTETFFGRTLREFSEIFPLLVFGAMATSIFQAVVPREFFSQDVFGHAGAILLMMLLAFVLSVCSSVDAFIALGYAGAVPPSALLAFLVFGPMIDAKNVLIYSKVFTVRGIIRISVVVAMLVFSLALLIDKTALLAIL